MYMRGFEPNRQGIGKETNMFIASMLVGFEYFFMVLFIIVCCFLVLLVLIQKGRGGGLSGAFGGAGGNTAFGSKTGDVLTWVTSIVFGVFLLLAIAMNLTANAVQNTITPHTAGTSVTDSGGVPTPPTGK